MSRLILNYDETVTYNDLVKVKYYGDTFNLSVIKKDTLDDNARVIGFINAENKKEDKQASRVLKLTNEGTEYEVPIERESNGKVVGYVKVQDADYVGVYRNKSMFLFWLLPISLLIVGLVIGIGFVVKGNGDAVKPSKELADTIKSDGIVTNNDKFVPSQGEIMFAGYSLVYATAEEPYILLENPEANDVYFTYTIVNKDTGEIILAETGLIEPGTAYQWDAKSMLEVGEHEVLFKVKTYDKEDTEKEYTPVELDNIIVKIY